jgi:hypothetical protein
LFSSAKSSPQKNRHLKTLLPNAVQMAAPTPKKKLFDGLEMLGRFPNPPLKSSVR